MTRLMIIPAAGRGSRLGLDVSKVLAPVAGRPMIDHLLARYGPIVDRFVVVASPAGRESVATHLHGRRDTVDIVVQGQPTGMLDGILAACEVVREHRPARVWVTWCDQLAIHSETVSRLIAAETAPVEPALVMPTCEGPDPYIHFERDAGGRIVAVRQRREGDAMPPIGESDVGLFSLSLRAFLRDLAAYADTPGHGDATRERNFLPFIPWLASSDRVVTFPCTDAIEAIGINTPDELRRIEDYMRTEAGRRAIGEEDAS